MNTSRETRISKKPPQAFRNPAINENPNGDIATEKHYSVPELARLWELSEKTIRRMFEKEPGVIVWGVGETRFKRRYRTLRIPERVVVRVHRQLRIAV